MLYYFYHYYYYYYYYIYQSYISTIWSSYFASRLLGFPFTTWYATSLADSLNATKDIGSASDKPKRLQDNAS